MANYKIQLLLGVFLILNANKSFGQNVENNLTFNIGASKMVIADKNKLGLSGFLGWNQTRKIKDRSSWGFEILLSYIAGKSEDFPKDRLFTYPDGTEVYISNINTDFDVDDYYVAIPVYYEYNVNNFAFNIGFQNMFRFYNLSKWSTSREEDGEPLQFQGERKDTNLKYFFGGRIGMVYDLNDLIKIRANCSYINYNGGVIFYSFNPAQSLQITVGLNIRLGKVKASD